jgi:hypothetical protein
VSKIKRMPIAEFREFGFQQEVNRLYFHPLGLALEVVCEDDGTMRLGGIQDFRDDPEGMGFTDSPTLSLAQQVEELRQSKEEARRKLWGAPIQPAC